MFFILKQVIFNGSPFNLSLRLWGGGSPSPIHLKNDANRGKTMKEVYISGVKGKFFSDEEFNELVELVRHNNQLINELKQSIDSEKSRQVHLTVQRGVVND